MGVAAPAGYPALADSQIYITLAPRPDLDGRYAIFGQLIRGLDVIDRLSVGDVVIRMRVEP